VFKLAPCFYVVRDGEDISPRILNLTIRLVASRPGRLTLWEQSVYPLYSTMDGSQSRCEQDAEENEFWSFRESNSNPPIPDPAA
jgi:hypothetical protein